MEDKRPTISEERKNRVRLLIYSLGGMYLIYNAYCMYREISVTSDNEQILMIVFSILYFVIGVGLNLFALSMAYKMGKKEKNNDEGRTE